MLRPSSANFPGVEIEILERFRGLQRGLHVDVELDVDAPVFRPADLLGCDLIRLAGERLEILLLGQVEEERRAAVEDGAAVGAAGFGVRGENLVGDFLGAAAGVGVGVLSGVELAARGLTNAGPTT